MTNEKLSKGVSIMEQIKAVSTQIETLKRCDTIMFTLESISATVKFKERFEGDLGVFTNEISQFCANQKQELINFLLQKIKTLEKEFEEL